VADDVKAAVVAGSRRTQLPHRKVTASAMNTGSPVTQSALNTNRLPAGSHKRQITEDNCKMQ